MEKFGIDALLELPDAKKVRRVFSFLDTTGTDVALLQRKLQSVLSEYEPVEIEVPTHIKNVNKYFNRWDLNMFYRQVRDFQETLVQIQEGNKTKTMKRNDFLPYTGDVDTLIPVLGNMLFIDEKESVDAIKINQTVLYLSLAKVSNQTVWYVVGPTPSRFDNSFLEAEYKLCEIHPSGEFNWYKGSLVELMKYMQHWMEKSYQKPLVDEHAYTNKAKELIKDSENDDNYQTLSHIISELNKTSLYKKLV